MYCVKSIVIEEIKLTAVYYITIDMCNLQRPFGIRVETSGGECEEAKNLYATATEAYDTAVRYADAAVLPGTLRDIIRDEMIGLTV